MFFTPLLSRQFTPVQRTRSVVATLVALSLAAGAARAQVVDPNMWGADGAVFAIAVEGNTIYLGGSFSGVSPNTGHAVGIDVGTGAPERGWPRVNGTVICSAADGAGGWYIGGVFTSVEGVARTNLAHIRADKTLDPWNPDPFNPGTGGNVLTLAVNGSTVYAGGLSPTSAGRAAVASRRWMPPPDSPRRGTPGRTVW
jgi:hypothetical protein